MNLNNATLDALREAMAHVVASHRKQWSRERELIEAQARATVAELRAEVLQLRTLLEKTVGDKLAEVKDGNPGPQGELGAQGPEGPQGPAGERGEPGEVGPSGPPGPAGAAGEPGQPGSNGEKGEPGPQGAKGESGLTVKGDRGERGERGLQGERGLKGERGELGLTVKGEPGPQGAHGERGEKGDRGEAGAPGLSIKGERGDRGERGERGLQGEAGKMGLRGEPGQSGARGESGQPGERGERGPMGILPRVKIWEPGVHYAGNVVTAGGATYQALQDTAAQPGESKDWACLARAGVDGRSVEIRGLFDPEAEYRRLDIVALNGGSFIAKADNPGLCPGPGWQLMVSQGKAGQRGERGLTGEKGARGEPGMPAAVIEKWQIDRDRYVAVPIMSDGREGPPLQMRAFFEQFQIETR